MGFFSSIGRSLTRPYVRVTQDISKSAKGIRDSLGQLKAADAKSQEVNYFQAPDGKQAFELLYAKGNWTPEELSKQQRAVHRTKWAFIVCTALSIVMFFAFGITSTNVFFTLISTGFASISTALFAVRSVQYAIFQTQLDERELITFREFMARSDFWKRMFS